MQTTASGSRQTFWLVEGSEKQRCRWGLPPFQHHERKTEGKERRKEEEEGQDQGGEEESRELMATVCATCYNKSTTMAAV